jgi:hypothetical protein
MLSGDDVALRIDVPPQRFIETLFFYFQGSSSKGKGKTIPLQALTDPEAIKRLRLPDFKTIGTWSWQGCQTILTPRYTPGTHFC